MKTLIVLAILLSIAAIVISSSTFVFGPMNNAQKTRDEATAVTKSGETLAFLRKGLFDEATIKRVTESIITRSNVSKALEPAGKKTMTEFVRVMGINIVVIPLTPDKDGKKDPFELSKTFEVFAWLGQYEILAANTLSQIVSQLPQTLDDGRQYDIELNAVLFPDLGSENARFQETLGRLVYPHANMSSANNVPVIVMERQQPILPEPNQEWQKIAAAKNLREGMKLYQTFSVTGYVKTVEVTLVEISPNGALVLDGTLDSLVKGELVFTGDGLPAAIVVEPLGNTTAAALPLEQIMSALLADKTIQSYEKSE